jgi:polar amino acid transport system substrate-binding protein
MPIRPALVRGRAALGRNLALSCVVGLTVVLAAACSSSSSTSGKTTSSAAGSASGLPKAQVEDLGIISHISKDPAIADLLPAKYRGATLTVATDAEYAPDEFETANHTIVGWDPDLGLAVGKVLGVNIRFANVQFDSIIPGLQAGRYNFAMSSMGAYPYRVKLVDFVTTFDDGTTFMVRSDETNIHITGMSSLCGLTVAAQAGSIEALDAQAEEKNCPSAKPMHLLTYPEQPDVNLALSSGRAQVDYADSPIVAYQVSLSNGAFKQTGPILLKGLQGIAVPKTEGIAEALNAAVNKLISDGTWKQLLDSWGQASGMISHSVLITSPSQVNAQADLTGKA